MLVFIEMIFYIIDKFARNIAKVIGEFIHRLCNLIKCIFDLLGIGDGIVWKLNIPKDTKYKYYTK